MFDVLGWLNYLLDSFKNIVFGIFESFWYFVKDCFFWLIDQFFTFGDYVFTQITSMFPEIGHISSSWGSLPGELLWVLSASGVDTAIGMIVSAMAIRFVLNFIPFVK